MFSMMAGTSGSPTRAVTGGDVKNGMKLILVRNEHKLFPCSVTSSGMGKAVRGLVII